MFSQRNNPYCELLSKFLIGKFTCFFPKKQEKNS
jgi:hypothetical protein